MGEVFTVTITAPPRGLGELPHQERQVIATALQDIAQELGSGAPLGGVLKDRNGTQIGTYGFGPGALANQAVDLYRRAKEVLGPDSERMVAGLIAAKGGAVAVARIALEKAATSHNPRDHISGVIREHTAERA